jgi:Ca-activated chloride channel homolog
MTRRAATLALALALASSSAARQTFRSGVDIVRVDALVTDGRRPIGGLRAEDFELRDNGVLQAIDSIALDAVPLTVTFVLDTSGSVAGQKMSHLSSAVGSVLKGMRQQDRAALVTFSHRIWQRMALTSDPDRVRRVLTAADAEGGTALNDAVYAGLALSESQEARPLVLVFSDGLDNASWLPSDTVEQAARRADAVVYGVAVAAGVTYTTPGSFGVRSRELQVPRYAPGQTDFLEAVASATGGRVLKADTTTNLPKAFDEILQEFRTRYQLTYSPRGVDAPGWHTIDVKVRGRRADVRARRGYERR